MTFPAIPVIEKSTECINSNNFFCLFSDVLYQLNKIISTDFSSFKTFLAKNGFVHRFNSAADQPCLIWILLKINIVPFSLKDLVF